MIQSSISQVRHLFSFYFVNKQMNFTNKFYLQSNSQIDSMIILDMASISLQAFATAFVSCEMGQQLTNTCSDKIGDVFDRIDWYLYPLDVQRILPTAILYVQQPIEVKFFGSFSCNREVFLRVSIKIYKLCITFKDMFL